MAQITVTAPPPVAARGVGTRLAIMMFLQWAVPGVYAPIISVYLMGAVEKGGLGFTGKQVGWISGLAGALGALAAPFVAGQVADRYLNAERAMAILLLVGGSVQFVLAGTTTYVPFLMLSIVATMALAPNAALTNSICFQNLSDKERRFPFIRAFGTVGWLAASNVFGWVWLGGVDEATRVHRIADALRVSAVLAIVFAVYSLLGLPKTPPKRNVANPLAFAKAFRLFAHPGFLVVAIVALPLAMVHNCYFIRTGPYLKQDIHIAERWIATVIGIGQMSEIVFLALLALFLRRLGYKWVLALGGLGYVVRYAVFALGTPAWLVIAAQGLHGLCYGCFYAGAFLYVERIAAADIRHSAQMVLGLVLTVGPLLAGLYNGYFDRFTQLVGDKQVQSYTEFWWTSAAVSLVAMLVLIACFRPGIEMEPARPAAAG